MRGVGADGGLPVLTWSRGLRCVDGLVLSRAGWLWGAVSPVRPRGRGVSEVGGALPAFFEAAEEVGFDFGGDVAVGLDEPVAEVVAEAARLGDLGDVVGDEPGLWLCRSPWKVSSGRTAEMSRRRSPSQAGRRTRRSKVLRRSG